MPAGLILASVLAVARTAAPEETTFVLDAPAEVTAEITASCPGCDWGVRGREAAALELRVDGGYSQHVLLARGVDPHPYRVALGRLAAGPHRLQVAVDARWSARGTRQAQIASVSVAAAPPGSDEERRLAHAPILHARPGSLGRFSDLPLVAWVEEERRAEGGRRLRYSVVFSNEDGGTPPDRLMATWGRLTDLEYVYGITLDAADGAVGPGEYQGPKHRLLPFRGAHEAAHPILYVVTDNNMVSDRGRSGPRFRPMPLAVDLAATSREAVMDANPWTYAVSVAEVRREGRVRAGARPGSERIPDPRRFATVEACAETKDATIAFSVGVRGADGTVRFHDSDAGLPRFRIGRGATEFPNGCFRGAVALRPGTAGTAVAALRFRAFTRLPAKGEAPLPPGSGQARLQRVNSVFLLGPDDRPGPSLFSWTGDRPLPADGDPVELSAAAPGTSARP